MWKRYFIFVALVAAVIFAIENMTFYAADDFGNMRSYYCHNPLPIGEFPTWGSFISVPNAFGNVLSKAYNHYWHETGRFFSGGILRVMAGMPRWLYALFAMIAFVGLVNKLLDFANVGMRHRIEMFSYGVIVLLCSDAVLWLSGASNYLFPAAFIALGANLFFSRSTDGIFLKMKNCWMIMLTGWLIDCQRLI